MKLVNGLLEVYPQQPWVYKNATLESERGLIDRVRYYFEYVDMNPEPIQRQYFGEGYFIKSSEICRVTNGFVGDEAGNEYPFCEILMNNGEIFYAPDLWQNIFAGEEDEQ